MTRNSLSHSISIYHTFDLNRNSLSHIYHHLRYEQKFPITQYFDLPPPLIWTEIPSHSISIYHTFDMTRNSLSHNYHHLRYELKFPVTQYFDLPHLRYGQKFLITQLPPPSIWPEIPCHTVFRFTTPSIWPEIPYHTVTTTFDMTRNSLSHNYHHLRYEQKFPVTQYFDLPHLRYDQKFPITQLPPPSIWQEVPYHTVITTFDMTRSSLSHSYHHLRYKQKFPLTQYFY
jgi:hypothetical protein